MRIPELHVAVPVRAATDGHAEPLGDAGDPPLGVRGMARVRGTERRIPGMAQRLGMAISGGSDWHGDLELGDSHAPLGGLDIPMEWLEKLEERRATTSSKNVAQKP